MQIRFYVLTYAVVTAAACTGADYSAPSTRAQNRSKTLDRSAFESADDGGARGDAFENGADGLGGVLPDGNDGAGCPCEGPDGADASNGDHIVTRAPTYNICWTKALANNKETVLTSPGVSYKLYDYSGRMLFAGNTTLDAAARSKAYLQQTKSIKFHMPKQDGNYLLAFCDASKHDACTMPGNVMSSLGGNEKNFGFRNLRDAPAVIGAIPNLRVSGGKLVSASQPFIIYDSEENPYCEAAWSPLVVDLKGQGIALSSKANGVLFDIDGNGTKDQISWPLKPASAFVALDRNGNGNIDSVFELFGNNTVGPDGEKSENGFTALRKYDLNADGALDAKDEIYKSLVLWGDKNRNGVSEPDELVSLDKGGVAAIDLGYIDIFEVDAYGNQTLQRSTVETIDKKGVSTFRMIFDVWFAM